MSDAAIEVLKELSGELDKWISGSKSIPNNAHNRAVISAVSVMSDAVAITRARYEARQSDAESSRKAKEN
jgi:phage portal protein BeeE